jgi:hypothetical protein
MSPASDIAFGSHLRLPENGLPFDGEIALDSVTCVSAPYGAVVSIVRQ